MHWIAKKAAFTACYERNFDGTSVGCNNGCATLLPVHLGHGGHGLAVSKALWVVRFRRKHCFVCLPKTADGTLHLSLALQLHRRLTWSDLVDRSRQPAF